MLRRVGFQEEQDGCHFSSAVLYLFRKNKMDATVAFPHLCGLSKEEDKREYEKLIGRYFSKKQKLKWSN